MARGEKAPLRLLYGASLLSLGENYTHTARCWTGGKDKGGFWNREWSSQWFRLALLWCVPGMASFMETLQIVFYAYSKELRGFS